MAVENLIYKEPNLLNLNSESIVIMNESQTLTSAISTIHNQINVLNRQVKQNKSFAWRHSRRKRRRY